MELKRDKLDFNICYELVHISRNHIQGHPSPTHELPTTHSAKPHVVAETPFDKFLKSGNVYENQNQINYYSPLFGGTRGCK